MKRNILLIAIFFMISVTSCKKFLEVEPTTAVGDNVIFSSTKNVEINIIGLYGVLVWSSYGPEGYNWVFGPDMMGEDMLVISSRNYGRLSSAQYPFTITPGGGVTRSIWRTNYRIIKGCNDVINKIDDESIKGTTEDKNKLKGEALVLRAFCHHSLIRLYGEEVYNQNIDARGIVLDTVSDLTQSVGRSKVKDAYNLILSDLNRAIDLLPTRGSAEKWRMDKLVAHAILARVYLEMKNWKQASVHAKEARQNISDGSNLMDTTTYLKGFNTTEVETLWEHSFVQGTTLTFVSLPSFAYTKDGGEQGFILGYSSLRVTKTFANLFASTDVRSKLFPKDASGNYITHYTKEGALYTKFRHRDKISGLGNFPRIRTAEMYLMEAEAEAELGNTSNAQDILFVLQKKRNKDAIKTSSTGQTLIDEILLERRKELFSEGHRVYDLKRRHLDMVREDADHWGSVKTIQAGDYRFALPIPTSEIDANKAMTIDDQNKGYK